MRILIVALAAILLLPLAAQAAPSQTLAIPGLSQPVEIIQDRWGVSHIYAKNENDLFFAQGYNAARHRLFQLEMWRRQATGTVSEILGPSELKRDIGNRLFQYRGDMKQELSWYHPHSEAIIESFALGVNAFIAQTERDPALLTPEFKMLGIRPGKWTPAIVVSRFNGLARNLDDEMNTALAVRAIGADKVRSLASYQPANPRLEIDPAVDAALLSKSILTYYDAMRAPLMFKPEQLLAEYRRSKGASAAKPVQVASVIPTQAELADRRADMGSNNWVVSGRLAESGMPMVTGDPHRVQEIPSLRYWVHLNAPGWNVIGAGEPSIPGVSYGHNDHGAWGYTIYGTDTEDLYVYDINPANPLQYKFGRDWETMRVVHESVPVKRQAAEEVDLKFTRHGPVLFEDKLHHKAYAARAAWLEPGGSPYLAMLRVDQAQNWTQFADAISYARTPALNFVWGDKSGDIGYNAATISPRRMNFSGLVPVPGDGRYEWNGFLPIKELPHVLNPDKGFYNTSNDWQVPVGYPHMEAIHYVWADPYRGRSVAEQLGGAKKFSVADMINLQNYNLSIPARSIVPLLRDIAITDPVARKAAARLLHWDFILDKDSVEAGIYEMFQRRLMVNVKNIIVPAPARDALTPPMTRIVSSLAAPDGSYGADPLAGRNAVLVQSLEQACADLTGRLGTDMEKWTLGAYHYARIIHPMTAALRPDLQEKFDVGHFPRGGDNYTITATGGTDNQGAGASFKIVSDTYDWDASVGQNNPGQSGDVSDPHYRDLYELWARGKYFPVFFSRPKVESVAEKTILLAPQ
ncbi:MAG: penicillin acylase family protein [Alphaproteobacteria bacterium]|nr:penicillin acylase family protein [Alphaproteobacteria bacterium]